MIVPFMKPKDLAYPFSFRDRRLFVERDVFYLPNYLSSYEGFDPKLPLGHPRIFIEFCSGNGEWIIQKALENPDIQFIAVEKLFLRVQKIFSKRENLGIKNLFLVSGDINLLLEHFLPDDTVDTLAVNFPDPWPKERHSKNRLFHKNFVAHIQRILKPHGEVFVVTDDSGFSEWVYEAMKGDFKLKKEDVKKPLPNHGSSFFQRLWESKGKDIFYHHYQKGSYVGCEFFK
ncbi:MAG: tRNA (guanosine(46)-N7)-methyltransferase TrmB [Chlamydiae bacterium]|nr:tRNA (guanosine(46)-N7)-methyltransferase TrmB [Chlamydiota bacterium]